MHFTTLFNMEWISQPHLIVWSGGSPPLNLSTKASPQSDPFLIFALSGGAHWIKLILISHQLWVVGPIGLNQSKLATN